jgi:hypothetical protein
MESEAVDVYDRLIGRRGKYFPVSPIWCCYRRQLPDLVSCLKVGPQFAEDVWRARRTDRTSKEYTEGVEAGSVKVFLDSMLDRFGEDSVLYIR